MRDKDKRWWEEARCQDMDVNTFFDPKQAGRALLICRGCPVREECIADCDAREPRVKDIFGIVGGETPDDRRRRREGHIRRRSVA